MPVPAPEVRPGALVTLAVSRRLRLDGFLVRPARPTRTLLLFVHGMGSNFYRASLKKAFLDLARGGGPAVFSFNNRGAEGGTVDEPFAGCLADLDAALRFGRAAGFRRFVLAGHSTGCQKIVHYQARRCAADVAGLVLLAPADDFAIGRRDLGPAFARTVARARSLVKAGRGGERITGMHQPFSARRFLSIADRRRAEAAVFDYEGPMRGFRAVSAPVLALFGSREEFAVMPVRAMLDCLAALHPAGRVTARLVPGADHGFHRREASVAALTARWIRGLPR
ncbi:MAG: alpha/beta fold hydrolase [Lentisphaerae bacterium]|nr:alpha/beta fold hydrolase [Lentisphaerota bacterium]